MVVATVLGVLVAYLTTIVLIRAYCRYPDVVIAHFVENCMYALCHIMIGLAIGLVTVVVGIGLIHLFGLL